MMFVILEVALNDSIVTRSAREASSPLAWQQLPAMTDSPSPFDYYKLLIKEAWNGHEDVNTLEEQVASRWKSLQKNIKTF